ncbi:MAG: GAF domain-containing protein [Mycobacterium sp.]|uniref:GAF domain-containing protein n=1 Tax=Mycolicibacterium poriferae TaxID=39694 RepID=UPI0024BAD76E|nr:GAF domain-containing protein [Mycolicibacterium poriferae]MCK5752936.1 GAF domain-containing protein [Mycobacterium sp.]
MTASRDRLAIAELTATLTGEFDLPTVLDTVAQDAREGFDATSAAVILLDGERQTGDTGVQVVAEALSQPTDADLSFIGSGPGLDSARGGAVTMVPDLADATDTRWPDYRRQALRAGMRGMRGFPVSILGSSVGALVIHTGEPWGVQRSNDFGQVLANLTALAISIAPHVVQRRSDTSDTIATLLQGTVTIATATGILVELSGLEPAQVRLQLHRLARAHQRTVTEHAAMIVAAHNEDPSQIKRSPLLSPPAELAPPPHIDT